MAIIQIPSGTVYTLDGFVDFDFVSHPLTNPSVSLDNIAPNQKVKVTLTFQHRATPTTPQQDLFHNGFYYFIQANADSEMKHLGGGGTEGSQNAVQAHLGWTTSATVAYFVAPNAPTNAIFTVVCIARDLGHQGTIMNLVLSAERL